MDDEIRGVRQRRKQTDPTCCPVCGITVRSHEIEQHFLLEVDRLNKLTIQKGRKSLSTTKEMPSITNNAGCSSSGAVTATAANETNVVDGKKCWATYQRIKTNRSARLKTKNRKRKADDPMCPICNERIADDLNLHVEICLRRSENNNGNRKNRASDNDDDDDDSIDVEGESFEEYEWAGQTRVRASSLLEGGYSAIGFQTAITNSSNTTTEEDEEDLNVDGDDSQIFGSPQYNERDIILPMADDNKKENLYLRNLVIGQPSMASTNNSIEPKKRCDSIDIIELNENGRNNSSIDNGEPSIPAEDLNRVLAETQIKCESTASSSTITINLTDGSVKETTTVTNQPQYHTTNTAAVHIIEALKEKIREYEVIIKNKSKCLICMDEFRIPVVSICCWHVHCEECWLRTLGARKLCPQCNMITSPADLRRIYM